MNRVTRLSSAIRYSLNKQKGIPTHVGSKLDRFVAKTPTRTLKAISKLNEIAPNHDRRLEYGRIAMEIERLYHE